MTMGGINFDDDDKDKGSTTIQHPRDYCQNFKLTFFHHLQCVMIENQQSSFYVVNWVILAGKNFTKNPVIPLN